jgi:copper transport protein
MRGRAGALREVVQAWSRGALAAVAALVLTGTALIVVQSPDLEGLGDTDWGKVLLAKLALVGGLLCLAGLNRAVLTPALGGGTGAERRLAVSASIEVGLALAILGLVGLWRFTPPPRALPSAGEPRPAAVAHLHGGAAMAEVRLLPGRAGPSRIRLVLSGPSAPLAAKDVTVRFAHPTAGVEPIERRASTAGPGAWDAGEVVLPVPGAWRVSVDILVTDFEQAVLEGSVEVAP